MKFATVASLTLAISSVTQAAPFHEAIPQIFQGVWAPTLSDCRDPDGVNQVFIDNDSVNYCEANDYLIIGVQFSGSLTRGGSGELFNGRFTSRSETALLNESNIRFEIDDINRDVLYRYPIGDDGEAIAQNEVRSVRCQKAGQR